MFTTQSITVYNNQSDSAIACNLVSPVFNYFFISCHWFLSTPREKIRKTLVFGYFRGYRKNFEILLEPYIQVQEA